MPYMQKDLPLRSGLRRHACSLLHDGGSCVSLESGELLLTVQGEELAITMPVNYCPVCGTPALTQGMIAQYLAQFLARDKQDDTEDK